MSRTSRQNMKNSSFFHIMVQGINKEYIFNTKEDKEKYIKIIFKNNMKIHIIAYCVMDNHTHILVKTGNIKDLETWMRKSNTKYALYYNQKNDRVGYVFRDRYKMQPIKNVNHFYLCVQYIHDNPIKAFICHHREDYEYSSYMRIYQGNVKKMQEYLSNVITETQMQSGNIELEEFKFLEDKKEDKEQKCKDIIKEFLESRKLQELQLTSNEQDLIELIEILKCQNDISYRVMEKCLKISREKLRILIKNRKID